MKIRAFSLRFSRVRLAFLGLMLCGAQGWSQESSGKDLMPLRTMPMAMVWEGTAHLKIQTKLVEKEDRTYLVVMSEPKAGESVAATSMQVQVGLSRWTKGGRQVVMNALSPAPHDWSLPPYSMGDWHADAVRYAWFDLAPLLAHWRNQESLQDRLQATTLHFDDQTSVNATWRHHASHLAWWALEMARHDPARLVELMESSPAKQMRVLKAARRQARRQARGGTSPKPPETPPAPPASG